MATLIKAETGLEIPLQPSNEKWFTIGELKTIIQATDIQILPYKKELVFVVNGRVRSDQYPINKEEKQKWNLAQYMVTYILGQALNHFL